MALTTQQINSIIKTLSDIYGKVNVSYKSPKITVFVEVPKNKEDRAYRKHKLSELQKAFSSMGASYTPPTDGSTGSVDRKSTRLNSSHTDISRMPSSA